MCVLWFKKPTALLPQLGFQLPEAAITSIPPLLSEPPPHRYRGGPKNRQNDPPPPEPPPLRTDGLLRSPSKKDETHTLSVVALQSFFSTFVFFFNSPPKAQSWIKSQRERLQTHGAANRQSDEQYMQPWQSPLCTPRYSALTCLSPLSFFGKKRDALSSGGGGVWNSAASAQANRVRITQQRQCSSGSRAVALQQQQRGVRRAVKLNKFPKERKRTN